MRPVRRAANVAVLFSLVLTLLTPLQAHALKDFLQRPATQWGHTFAGNGNVSSANATTSPIGAKAEAQSKFIINYRNFPDWAKKDFDAAVNVWAANFQSDVPITIDATWMRISSSSVLGSARPGSYFAGFDGAPDASLWYPSALANALAGKDLDPTESEMVIQVNSIAQWNTTNDGLSHFNQYDLQSVFIHEMGHGLGFLSTDSYDSFFGYGSIDQPTPFDAYAQTEDGRRLSDLPSPSRELGNALTSTLYWSGKLGIAANNGVKPILYTPSRYEEGSSVSHLDESTFSQAGLNAVMTPNLDAGEIFHHPGPLLLAMMADMRIKPPAGVAIGVPETVRNVAALAADSSAIITFDPPVNARTAQVTSYTVRNLKTGNTYSATQSPVRVTGLRNGSVYSFSVIASNTNGSSVAVTTNSVTPQSQWSSTSIDSDVEVRRVVSTTFNNQQVLVYIDDTSGYLKMATFNGKTWSKRVIDGNGGGSNRTSNKIGDALSLCVSGSGLKQTLHIFYGDQATNDLRYALFNGKTFTYEVVDGDGPSVNNYEDSVRVRTASDVSVSSACIASSLGVQVFYRDESQGIVLGAVKTTGAKSWTYELLDGDRKTDGRTTGDVAFHISAVSDGKKSYVLYDSVLTINAKKEVTSGEIRIATRTDFKPSSWSYQTFEATSAENPVVGFDVALARNSKGVFATWMVGASNTLPKANRVRWSYVGSNPTSLSVGVESLGTPSKFLSTDGSMIAYNCQQRLCAIDVSRSAPKTSLVTTAENPDGIASTWVTVKGIKYLAAGVKNRLVLLRATS